MTKSKRLISLVIACVLVTSIGRAVYAAVDLAYFEGDWDDEADVVTLDWGTGSELDNAGFHVWRSENPITIVNGQINTSSPGVERLTTSVITSSAACTVRSDQYLFRDDEVAGEDVYYYYLESFHCQSSGSEFKGDGNVGLMVSRPGASIPTATSTTSVATATRTVAATSAGNPTNTPAPSETAPAQPGQPSSTPQANPTNTRVASATVGAASTAAASATRVSQPPAQPTSPAAPPVSSQPTIAVATAAPGFPTTPPEPVTVDPVTGAFPPAATAPSGPPVVEEEGVPGAPGTEPDPTTPADVAVAISSDSNSTAAVPGGAMSPQSAAATPTLPSGFGALPPDQQTLIANQSTTSDGLDRLMQGVIALILLGTTALIGFAGWSYVKR